MDSDDSDAVVLVEPKENGSEAGVPVQRAGPLRRRTKANSGSRYLEEDAEDPIEEDDDDDDDSEIKGEDRGERANQSQRNSTPTRTGSRRQICRVDKQTTSRSARKKAKYQRVYGSKSVKGLRGIGGSLSVGLGSSKRKSPSSSKEEKFEEENKKKTKIAGDQVRIAVDDMSVVSPQKKAAPSQLATDNMSQEIVLQQEVPDDEESSGSSSSSSSSSSDARSWHRARSIRRRSKGKTIRRKSAGKKKKENAKKWKKLKKEEVSKTKKSGKEGDADTSKVVELMSSDGDDGGDSDSEILAMSLVTPKAPRASASTARMTETRATQKGHSLKQSKLESFQVVARCEPATSIARGESAQKQMMHSCRAESQASSATPTQKWSCTRCTCLNEHSALSCSACNEERPVPGHHWKCLNCPRANLKSSSKCATCGADRPETTSGDQSGVESSGVADLSSDDSVPPAVRPLPKPRPQWKCKPCGYQRNPMTCTECFICSRPRGSPNPAKVRRRDTERPSPERMGVWVDKHQPKTVEDIVLGVHKDKVEVLRKWMSQWSGNETPLKGTSNVLLLHGPPGSCKSSTIAALAREAGLSVREWTTDRDHAGEGMRKLNDFARGGHADEVEAFTSELESFKRFLRHSSYRPLQLKEASGNDLLLIDSLPFLGRRDKNDHGRQQRALHSMLGTLSCTAKPVVLMYTSPAESSNPTEMKRTFGEGLMNSTHMDVKLPRVPETRVRRALQSILEKEQLEVEDEVLDSIVLEANGDLRNAIQNLQFHAVGIQHPLRKQQQQQPRKKRKAKTRVKKNVAIQRLESALHASGSAVYVSANGESRDAKTSMLHAVGKLLRAKTLGEAYDKALCTKAGQTLPPIAAEDRQRLEFDPDEVVRSCPLEPDGLLVYLHAHAPHYFAENDLKSLASAVEVFAHADVLAGTGARSGAGTWTLTNDGRAFPGSYVNALSSRAVAAFRTKPMRKTAFGELQIHKPEQYDLMERMRSRKAELNEAFRGPPCMEMGAAAAMDLAWFAPTPSLGRDAASGTPAQDMVAEEVDGDPIDDSE